MTNKTAAPLLEVKHLSFQYENGEKILEDINFSLISGQSLGIIGPNGGGKSTLLKIIMGLIKFQKGDILFKQQSIIGQKKSPLEIAYIPQTIQFNTTFPMSVYEYIDYYKSILGSKKEIKAVLAQVELASKSHFLLSHLSGGEFQRVLLAKTLLTTPQLLVLDEPTKGLDSKGQDELLGIIKSFKTKLNVATIIVGHNINQIIGECDKILCLNRDQHWHDHKEFLNNKILKNIYHCEFEHLLIHENFPGKHHCEEHE